MHNYVQRVKALKPMANLANALKTQAEEAISQRHAIRETGGLATLIAMLSTLEMGCLVSGSPTPATPSVRSAILQALAALAHQCPRNKDAIRMAGLPVLMRIFEEHSWRDAHTCVLEPMGSQAEEPMGSAAEALAAVAYDAPIVQQALLEAGLMPVLTNMVRGTSVVSNESEGCVMVPREAAQKAALLVLRALIENNAEAQLRLWDCLGGAKGVAELLSTTDDAEPTELQSFAVTFLDHRLKLDCGVHAANALNALQGIMFLGMGSCSSAGEVVRRPLRGVRTHAVRRPSSVVRLLLKRSSTDEPDESTAASRDVCVEAAVSVLLSLARAARSHSEAEWRAYVDTLLDPYFALPRLAHLAEVWYSARCDLWSHSIRSGLERMLQAINTAVGAGEFDSPPIGPIELFLEVKREYGSHAPAVRKALRSVLGFQFIVVSGRDEIRIHEIAGRLGLAPPEQMRIRSHEPRYDVGDRARSAAEVAKLAATAPRLLDVINIRDTHPAVPYVAAGSAADAVYNLILDCDLNRHLEEEEAEAESGEDNSPPRAVLPLESEAHKTSHAAAHLLSELLRHSGSDVQLRILQQYRGSDRRGGHDADANAQFGTADAPLCDELRDVAAAHLEAAQQDDCIEAIRRAVANATAVEVPAPLLAIAARRIASLEAEAQRAWRDRLSAVGLSDVCVPEEFVCPSGFLTGVEPHAVPARASSAPHAVPARASSSPCRHTSDPSAIHSHTGEVCCAGGCIRRSFLRARRH